MNTVFHANNANTLLICIDGKNISNTPQLFNEFQQLLNFPAYFGFNFDALEDMLLDLSWIPSQHVIIYFFRTEYLLSAPSEKQHKAILMDILQTCNNPKLDIILSDSNIQSSPIV
ncbi:MAG: barstar family protein [Chitinophagaceae bacterium]|nr:barstar family protein [Chitinophagaceae bacterium]